MLGLAGQKIDIEELCNRVCKKEGVSLGEMISGSRRHVVIKARRIVSWIAVRELGYSGAEVARYLGVTNSCITRFIASGEKPDLKGFI
jgi:putative transposase